MIPAHMKRSFPHAIRQRGAQYFADGRVKLVEDIRGALFRTAVKGTRTYNVALSTHDNLISASCTCPFAQDTGLCKHIWAATLLADEKGALAHLLETDDDDPLTTSPENNPAPATTTAPNSPLPDADTWDSLLTLLPDSALLMDNPSWAQPTRKPASKSRASTQWRHILDQTRREQNPSGTTHEPPRPPAWPSDLRLVYIIDAESFWNADGVPIELATEKKDRNGEWKQPVRFRLPAEVWQQVPDPLDQQIAQMLLGASSIDMHRYDRTSAGFVLEKSAIRKVLPLICATGRCRIRASPDDKSMEAVSWDSGAPWRLHLRLQPADRSAHSLTGVLRRGDEEMPLSEPSLMHRCGLLIAHGAFAQLDHDGTLTMLSALSEPGGIHVPNKQVPALLQSFYSLPQPPTLELPPESKVTEEHTTPIAGVAITKKEHRWRSPQQIVEPFFLYGTMRVDATKPSATLFDRQSLTVWHRDANFEREAWQLLESLGIREATDYGSRGKKHTIAASKIAPMVEQLVAAGWRVEVEGAQYRHATATHARVKSGIDWFELDAGVRFGDIEVSISDLLKAQRARSTTILLSDGTRGILPLDWLARIGPVLMGSKMVNGAPRYKQSQTALLDAMLATLPEASVDATFERAREKLRAFEKVLPANPPRTFRGTLREYQREGLGWLNFLRTFGLGGCLADDMGLGKTVQVLAMLDARRGTPKNPGRPSIVVVPRSLVFNWMHEAAHFTPRLRVLDHTGVTRDASLITSGNFDVVLITYGTLRRDAASLVDIQFDYAVLDEAQAIKTANSASAKAARLLRADHRLVMTGTPIENRLEELWSLFEFLNPGMLGGASTFAKLARSDGGDDGLPSNTAALSRALRPVILRRTKAEVAKDLPERVEQTLEVDLEGSQSKFYNDLLEAYRRSLLGRVDKDGIDKSRMYILEALLRLRQAACHPALADPRKTGASSAKLDALIPALEQVTAEGHKALVFSQFTSFLALLRQRLDEAGVTYEYLDGKTKDRQACVERFQSDDSCRLFLISLKAGGHGLNLTAADYVFILDPWWNPAVEAQAIDRAHRIGRSRRVIATRIVARNTIEAKILALQESKRALADAILNQDKGALAGIGREELEMLLA